MCCIGVGYKKCDKKSQEGLECGTEKNTEKAPFFLERLDFFLWGFSKGFGSILVLSVPLYNITQDMQ